MPIAIPNTFANQAPNWSLSQLDANFSALSAAINGNGDTVPGNITFNGAITFAGVPAGAHGYLGTVVFSVPTQTVTMTIASPCVVTAAAVKDTPENGSPIVFTTTGALPAGIVSGTTYWVISKGTDGAGKFRVAATKGGAAINTSGSQSGTHTANNPAYAKATGFNGIPSIIRVTVVGGGGGGGGSPATAAGQDSSGAPGAGAGAAIITLSAASLGASETVTTGAGGTGNSGAAGGNGGTSSFGAWESATGGTGGGTGAAAAGSQAQGVSGGTGTNGDINIVGSPSSETLGNATNNFFVIGIPGGSILGSGTGTTSANANGNASAGIGAGGDGTINGASQAARTGGTGYHGAVLVEEFA